MGKRGERVRVCRAGAACGCWRLRFIRSTHAGFYQLMLRMDALAIWEPPPPPNQGHMWALERMRRSRDGRGLTGIPTDRDESHLDPGSTPRPPPPPGAQTGNRLASRHSGFAARQPGCSRGNDRRLDWVMRNPVPINSRATVGLGL